MNPYKKPALEAHGLPIYQPKLYQSLLQSSVMPATSEFKLRFQTKPNLN